MLYSRYLEKRSRQVKNLHEKDRYHSRSRWYTRKYLLIPDDNESGSRRIVSELTSGIIRTRQDPATLACLAPLI